ncbi:MAG: hypothetical protein KGI51_04485 [Rhodospirillales bacterium]|nr:hypothetical protein [Rhodospirillales bacterium]
MLPLEAAASDSVVTTPGGPITIPNPIPTGDIVAIYVNPQGVASVYVGPPSGAPTFGSGVPGAITGTTTLTTLGYLTTTGYLSPSGYVTAVSGGTTPTSGLGILLLSGPIQYGAAFVEQFVSSQQISASFATLATAQESLMVGARPLVDALLGEDGPLDAPNQAGAQVGLGSALGGADGRYHLTRDLTLLAGAGYAQTSGAVHDDGGAILALALRYEAPASLAIRPFAEIAFWAMPGHGLRFTRAYADSLGEGAGVGTTTGTLFDASVRVGVALLPDPEDEVDLSLAAGPEWLSIGGYTEAASAGNPFPAGLAGGTASIVVGDARLVWTHRIGRVAFSLLGGVAHAFDPQSGPNGVVAGTIAASAALPQGTWAEFGLRLGWHVTPRVGIDVFTDGTAGNDGLGHAIHAGGGITYRF